MEEFEFIEHTAELGLRVKGKTSEDLFNNYAVVLFSLLTDYQPKQIINRKITLQAQSLSELLVDWLNELLSIFFADNFLPKEYFIKITDDKGGKILEAEIRGEEFNFENNILKREIKAATYHNVKVEENDQGYVGEVIFDV
ncbi:MAG: archease [Candidatus Susulua stagnicola]|nr:archease [Candidatus Susulua stagnicola]